MLNKIGFEILEKEFGRILIIWRLRGDELKKIVVFDYGWGGEVVADYLSRELGVVEVVRVIDWGNTEGYGDSFDRMLDLAQKSLERYIGQVDLIVLGGYAVSVLIDMLREMYPDQRFVGMQIGQEKMLNMSDEIKKVAVLGEPFVLNNLRSELTRELSHATLVLPDCTGWESLIDQNLMDRDVLQAELAWDFELHKKKRRISKKASKKQQVDKGDGRVCLSDAMKTTSLKSRMSTKDDCKYLRVAVQNFDKLAQEAKKEERAWAMSRAPKDEEGREKIKVDMVILLSTHFWAVKAEIEDLFGWRVRVVDFREKLLRDVCLALKLRGVDGRRPKK